MKVVSTGVVRGAADGLYVDFTFAIERGEPVTVAYPIDELSALGEVALTYMPLASTDVVAGEEVVRVRSYPHVASHVFASERGVLLQLNFGTNGARFVTSMSKAAAVELGQRLIALG